MLKGNLGMGEHDGLIFEVVTNRGRLAPGRQFKAVFGQIVGDRGHVRLPVNGRPEPGPGRQASGGEAGRRFDGVDGAGSDLQPVPGIDRADHHRQRDQFALVELALDQLVIGIRRMGGSDIGQ